MKDYRNIREEPKNDCRIKAIEVIMMAADLRRYELRDDEWERLRGYFEDGKPKGKGRPRSDQRTMLNGIIWIVRSGAAWRDMPERYGAYTTVYGWFKKWEETGLFAKILVDLGIEADLQDMSLDSTSCKAHPASAGGKKGLQTQKPTRRLD
jgi:transposase